MGSLYFVCYLVMLLVLDSMLVVCNLILTARNNPGRWFEGFGRQENRGPRVEDSDIKKRGVKQESSLSLHSAETIAP